MGKGENAGPTMFQKLSFIESVKSEPCGNLKS